MRTPHNERVTPDIAEYGQARVAPDGTRPEQTQPQKSGANQPRMKKGRTGNRAKKRATDRAAKTLPERRCIISGQVAPCDSLIRLAIAPSGLVLPDVQGKAPGRGAWIGVTRAELDDAQSSGKLRAALMRAHKGGPKDAALDIPEDLPDRIEQALLRLLLDRLGLELRCGNVVLGTQRIEKTARQGKVALLLHANDASSDGRKTLDQAWRVGSEEEGSGKRGGDLPLDRTALSVALGRDNVVHLALTHRQAAQRVTQALARLQHFNRAKTPGTTHDGAAVPADASATEI